MTNNIFFNDCGKGRIFSVVSFSLLFLLVLSLVSSAGYCNPNLPGGQNCIETATTTSNIIINDSMSNDTYYWQGYTPESYNQTFISWIPSWAINMFYPKDTNPNGYLNSSTLPATNFTNVAWINQTNIFTQNQTMPSLILNNSGVIQPTTTSTTALGIANSTGSKFVTFDTTNKRTAFGTSSAPVALIDIVGGSSYANAANLFNVQSPDVTSTIFKISNVGNIVYSPAINLNGQANQIPITFGDGNAYSGGASYPFMVINPSQFQTGNLLQVDKNSRTQWKINGSGSVFLNSNSSRQYFGNSAYSSIHYNGSDMIITPNLIGSGNLYNTGNITSTGATYSTTGSASLPSYSFNGDSNTGYYSGGGDTLRMSVGGSNYWNMVSQGWSTWSMTNSESLGNNQVGYNFGANSGELGHSTATYFRINPKLGSSGIIFQILKGSAEYMRVTYDGRMSLGGFVPTAGLDVNVNQDINQTRIRGITGQTQHLILFSKNLTYDYSGVDATGNIFRKDNVKGFYGDANDASCYYNATDLICNPKEVGTGKFIVSGDIANTGNIKTAGNVSIAGNLTVQGSTTIMQNLILDGNLSVKRPYWNGYDNSTQGFANTNSVQIINISNNNAYDNYAIHVVGNQNLTFDMTGDYQCTLSPEFFQNGGGSLVTFWFQKNGVDVPWSNSRYSMSNNQYNAPSIIYQFDIPNPTTDTIRFMWWSDSTSTQIYSSGTLTSPSRPSIPGILLTCLKVSEITP